MVEGNYDALRSAERVEKLTQKMIEMKLPFGFDIEAGYVGTDRAGIALQQFHPDWMLVGFSFTNNPDWARYVPVAHDGGGNVDDVVRTARAFWKLLQTGLGVAHNLSYELKGMSRWFRETLWDDPEVGEQVRASNGFFPFRSDTMIEAFLTQDYDPLRVGKDLKNLTKHIFGHQMTKFMDLWEGENIRGKTNFVRFNTRDAYSSKVINYACEDSVWCLRLHYKHYRRMVKDIEPEILDRYVVTEGYEDGEFDFIFKTEMKLLPVLIEMEQEGLVLDWEEIHRKTQELAMFRDLMNEEIQVSLSERLGEQISINLGSVKDLRTVLFDRLGLPVKMRSKKTNEASTSEKALRAIAKADPIIKKILEYREVVKLYGSYLNKYETQLNYAGNGRAYPNHNQVGAGTGRLSVDGVSYQQWPKPYHYSLSDGRTYDLNFRDLLISPPGYRIVGYDFSQVELRVLAGMADETAMLEAFASGVDIHKATVSNMMNIPIEEVTKKQRAVGKTLNFAIVYGSGPANIADLISTPDAPVSTEDAEELLRKYFAAFPGLRKWMDARTAEGREQGYVRTKFGRKYTVWEYRDHRDWVRSKGDRMTVNAPVQGGAADYMKIGMSRAQKKIKDAGMQNKIRLVMTIHDALEFYVHHSVSTQEVIDLLGPAVSFHVDGLPEIRADWHEGKKWGSVVEIKLDADKKIIGYGIEGSDEDFATVEAAEAQLEAMKVAGTAPVYDVPQFEEEDEDDSDLIIDESVVIEEPKPSTEDDEPPWAHSPTYVPETSYTVQMLKMPASSQWSSFMDYMGDRRGDEGSVVTVSTPEGDFELGRYKITEDDQPDISLALGGASVYATKSPADLILEGIEL